MSTPVCHHWYPTALSSFQIKRVFCLPGWYKGYLTRNKALQVWMVGAQAPDKLDGEKWCAVPLHKAHRAPALKNVKSASFSLLYYSPYWIHHL